MARLYDTLKDKNELYKTKRIKRIKRHVQSPKLYPYQNAALSWLLKTPKGILALEQGLGKTACVLRAIQKIQSKPKTLIVCPASVKYVWASEISKFAPNLTYQVLNTSSVLDESAEVSIINYDICQKMAPKIPSKWGILVLDESHYLKNPNAKRTRAALRWAHFASAVWALSGTPIPTKPIDIYALSKALKIFKMDYRSFGLRYCGGWDTPWQTFDVSGASNQLELKKKLAPYIFHLTKGQCLPGLPPKTYQVVPLDLPPHNREKSFSIEDLQGATRPKDIAGLPEIMRWHGTMKVPSAVEHISDLMESESAEPGPSLLVFAYHKDVIKELESKLGVKYETESIAGSTPLKERQEIVGRFQRKCTHILVAQIDTMKVGLTLTAASAVVFVEPSWDPSTIFQAVDRVHRIGQTKPVLAQFLTIHKSIDEYQLTRALQKVEVTSGLMGERSIPMENNERLTSALESIAESIAKIADNGSVKPRKRRTKEEIAADKAAEVGLSRENEPDPKPDPKPDPGPETPNLQESDIRMALREVSQAAGMATAQGVLKDFGAEKVSDIPSEKYEDFITSCKMAS